MFTVKATYRNETRKLSFPEHSSFPTYDQLYNQLYRVFPMSHDFLLSKLIFSPDASNPSRILIGREVHSAEEYNTCIAPLLRQQHGRGWPNALLRFSVFDKTIHKKPSIISNASLQSDTTPTLTNPFDDPVVFRRETSFDSVTSLSGHHAASAHSAAHKSFPPSLIPPPPIILYSSRRTDTTDSQGDPPHKPDPLAPFVSSSLQQKAAGQECSQQNDVATKPPCCCSIAQGKSDIQNLLLSFKGEMDRVLRDLNVESNFSQTNEKRPLADPTSTSTIDANSIPTIQILETPSSSAVPNACVTRDASSLLGYQTRSSFWCSVCRKRSTDIFQRVCIKCPWYTVCQLCCSRNDPSKAHQESYGPGHVMYMHLTNPFATLPVGTAPTHHRPAVTQSTNTSGPPSTAPVVMRWEESNGSSVVHRGIICDMCDKTIVGVRHKCLDCPDYDLCAPCLRGGSAEKHNPFHEFFDIENPEDILVHTIFSGRGERQSSHRERRHTRGGNSVPSAHSQSTASPSQRAEVERAMHSATCDLCDSNIVGDRYKCVNCPDFDTCSECFKITNEQHPRHGFVKISNPTQLMMRNALDHSTAHFATCNSCMRFIRGVRYKCMHPSCPDFDLCAKCEALPIAVHPPIHPMLKMKTPDTVIPTVYRVGQTNLINSKPFEVKESPAVLIPQPADIPEFDHRRSFIDTPLNPVITAASTLPRADNAPMIETAIDEPRVAISYPGSMFNRRSVVASLQLSPSDDSVPPLVPAVEALGKERESPIAPPGPSPLQSYSPLQALSSVGLPLPPLALDQRLDIFREHWPKVAEEMKHLTRQDLTQSPADVARSSSVSSGPLEPDHSGLGKEAAGNSVPMNGDDCVFTTEVNLIDVNESPLTKEALLATPVSFNGPEMSQRVPSAASLQSIYAFLNRNSTPSEPLSPLVPAERDDVEPRSFESESTVQAKNKPLSISAAFVADTTVPDGQIFPPGAEFVKSWRVLNDGGSAWPETTELVFVAGDSFSSSLRPTRNMRIGRADPGEDVDVWTEELKAPDVPGRYVGYWRLSDGQGNLFGCNIWVDINVVEHHSDESAGGSLASSAVIMPTAAPEHENSVRLMPRRTLSVTLTSPVTSKAESEDEAVVISDEDDDSSLSLVSVPDSSDVESVDSVEWQDSRSHVEASPAATRSAVEYVVLYDSSSSEDE